MRKQYIIVEKYPLKEIGSIEIKEIGNTMHLVKLYIPHLNLIKQFFIVIDEE